MDKLPDEIWAYEGVTNDVWEEDVWTDSPDSHEGKVGVRYVREDLVEVHTYMKDAPGEVCVVCFGTGKQEGTIFTCKWCKGEGRLKTPPQHDIKEEQWQDERVRHCIKDLADELRWVHNTAKSIVGVRNYSKKALVQHADIIAQARRPTPPKENKQ